MKAHLARARWIVVGAIVFAGITPVAAQIQTHPGESGATEKSLRILVPAAADDDGKRVVAVWRDGVRRELRPSSKIGPDGVLLTAEAPCVAGSVLVVESDHAIAAATLDGSCGDVIRLSPLRRSTMSARVTTPSAANVPASGVVRAADCGTGNPAIEVPVAIVNSKIVTGVPLGCRVLSLRVAGFSPVRLPALKDDELNRLGPIPLKPGSSVALRVRSSRDGDALPNVRVAAVRAHELAQTRGELDRNSLAIAEVVTDAAGWAHFSGLPEERLFFLLYLGERKYPQVSEPYSFRAGEETVIDDLVLESPANIVVTLSMPSSVAKSLEIDKVEVHPTGHNHWPWRAPLRTVLTPEGAVVEDVPPGSWSVVAAGRLKNGFVVRTAETTVEVVPGADQHVTLAITDSVYRGRVTRRQKPVKGAINLKPAGKARGRRAAVAILSAEGEFEVLLEGPGDYTATVQDGMGATVTLNRSIRFADPEEEAIVELPPGRIRGRVVNPAGATVERTTVSAMQPSASPGGDTSGRAAPDGTFELDSVATGTWEIVAESESARSEPATITAGDGDVEGVTLVVDPVEKAPVRVVDVTGTPMRGAVVIAEFPRADGTGLKRETLRTNGDGIAEFRVSRAQQATPTNLVIMTPDEQVSCGLRKLVGEQSIVVRPASGEVRLTGRQWGTHTGVRGWLISPGGCAVPFLAKSERDPSGEQAIVFSKLAAGSWTYAETRSPAELAALLTGRAATLASIKTFTNQAGGTTRVVLPPEQ